MSELQLNGPNRPAQQIPRKMVRIQRSFEDGDTTQFKDRDFPQPLLEKISADTLVQTIQRLNFLYREAETSQRQNLFDAGVAILTCCVGPLLFQTHYTRTLLQIERYIDEQNEQIYAKAGLRILQPKYSAKLFVSRSLRLVWES